MKQLKLSTQQLFDIGFVKVTHTVNDKNLNKVERSTFEINCLNGCFYYNPDEEEKVWYQRITIGDCSNHINLDIQKLPELFVILSTFKIPHKLIFN